MFLAVLGENKHFEIGPENLEFVFWFFSLENPGLKGNFC